MSNTQRIPEEWLQKLEGITPPEQEAKKDEPKQETVETPEQTEHAQQADDDADVRADEPLPAGTTLKYICNDEGEDVEVRYKIIRALKPGAFGMTYLAKRMADKGTSVVIKEFYPKGTARVMKSNRLIIDTNKSDITRQAFKDFKKEPERIQALMDEAGKKNPEHPQKEWDKLNLVVPLTNVFTCFGNHYYVMERRRKNAGRIYATTGFVQKPNDRGTIGNHPAGKHRYQTPAQYSLRSSRPVAQQRYDTQRRRRYPDKNHRLRYVDHAVSCRCQKFIRKTWRNIGLFGCHYPLYTI